MSSGKEGFPTVAFQVIVDHSTRILAVSPCYPGSHTDITISRLDQQINAIRFDSLFADFPFTLFVQPGVGVINQGVYLIADGGYQYWRVLQQTDKLNTGLFLAAAYSMFAQTNKYCRSSTSRIPFSSGFQSQRCRVHLWASKKSFQVHLFKLQPLN